MLHAICCVADDTIHEAVSAWLDDEASARQTYGDISMWDTSEVTNMASLFSGQRTFNADLSKWNVEKVTSIRSCKLKFRSICDVLKPF